MIVMFGTEARTAGRKATHVPLLAITYLHNVMYVLYSYMATACGAHSDCFPVSNTHTTQLVGGLS